MLVLYGRSHVPTGAQTWLGPSQPSGEKVRVLLADDHPAFLQHVSALLADDFDVVATLPDGEGVLRKDIELKPDLLILDISMPKVSGLEAARSLRQQGFNPYLIFLTVHEEPDFVQAAMACGASGLCREITPHQRPHSRHQSNPGRKAVYFTLPET
jgi:CheY-like chemotaxis protein